MLEAQEKSLRRERRLTAAMWTYLVLITTALITCSGVFLLHKVEGTYAAVTAVFWLLFGAVFLLGHQINKSRFEVIKEVKGVELRLADLEARLAGRDDTTRTPG